MRLFPSSEQPYLHCQTWLHPLSLTEYWGAGGVQYCEEKIFCYLSTPPPSGTTHTLCRVTVPGLKDTQWKTEAVKQRSEVAGD